MKRHTKLLFGSAIMAIVLLGCKNEDQEVSVQPDSESMVVNNQIEFIQATEFSLSNVVAAKQGSYSTTNAPTIASLNCPTITVMNGTFPKKFKVDYGTSGCVDSYGTYRKGILYLTLTNYLITAGSVLTVEREAYYVNGRKVEGTVTYTNTTTNQTKPSWSRVIQNGKITTANGLVYTHSGNRNVQMTSGFETATLDDNEVSLIDGTHTINKPNGDVFTATISQPLIKAHNCQHISSGVLTVKGTLLDGNINYGNKNCDNQATYTHNPNGISYNIAL